MSLQHYAKPDPCRGVKTLLDADLTDYQLEEPSAEAPIALGADASINQAVPATTRPVPDLKEIQCAFDLLFDVGQVVELRAPNTDKGTWTGNYNNRNLAEDAFELSSKETTPNVYWTIQQIRSDVPADNRCQPYARKTTNDDSVARYRWLPLDFDPQRPANSSATDQEKQAAFKVAEKTRSWLVSLNIPSIFIDSGNGYHALVRIDLPVSSVLLIKELLNTINARFGTKEVQVDTSVYNPSRILKVPGTVARKGPHTADRPWRTARIVDAPQICVIEEDELKALVTANSDPAEKPVDEYSNGPTLEGVDPIAFGMHDVTLTKIAGLLRHRGKEEEEIKSHLIEVCQKRCINPGLDFCEMAAKIAKSICRYPVGQETFLLSGKPPGSAISASVERKTSIQDVESVIDTTTATEQPEFPRWVMTGTSLDNGLVKPALEQSSKHAQFIFMPAVQGILNCLSDKVRISNKTVNFNLYLGLISPFGKFFKSSSVKLAHHYLRSAGIMRSYTPSTRNADGKVMIVQAGSPEGLGKAMTRISGNHAILFNDELGKLVAKAGIENSSLPYDLLSFYESDEWGNNIKSQKDSYTFEAGTYTFSWIWCTTTRGFNSHWPKIAGVASGMEDRVFFVMAPKEPKPPKAHSDPDVGASGQTLRLIDIAIKKGVYRYEDHGQLNHIVDNLALDPRSINLLQAFALYFAVDLGRELIDNDCLKRAAALVKYRLDIIKFLEPIEAENKQGRLQKEIIRELRQNGGMMKKRDLCRDLNYTSVGMDFWNAAYSGLIKNNITIEFDKKLLSGQAARMIGLLKEKD